MKARVIGSGITGVTTAYYLAKAGYEVEIFDERRYSAMATSFANGGQLSASNAETWNSWRNVWKGIKWLTDKSAPLKINPMPSVEKYSWLYKFVKAIPQANENTVKTCAMALSAHDLYKKIEYEENIYYDSVKRGILHFYKSHKEFDNAKRVNELYEQAGLVRKEITPQAAKDLEPCLNVTDVVGAFFNQTDFTGDIHKFCVELTKVLQDKYAVKVNRTKIKTLKDTKALTVVCAGVYSKALASTVGDYLPIYPVKGYSITINNPVVAPWISLLDDESKIVTARLGKDRFRVAGTAEFTGYNTDIIQDRIQPLIDWVETNIKETETEYVNRWAGLRPMTPNMMPIVKKSTSNKHIWYNTGHGHLGWTLGAFTANQLVNSITSDYKIG